MFRVRTGVLYDRPPQVDSDPLRGPAACVPQMYNSRINGRDFFECTYRPVTQSSRLSLRAAAPHPSDSNLFATPVKRRASPRLECMAGSVSETNGRTARSISCKPYGKSFPVIITAFVMCFYLSHLSHPVKYLTG